MPIDPIRAALTELANAINERIDTAMSETRGDGNIDFLHELEDRVEALTRDYDKETRE